MNKNVTIGIAAVVLLGLSFYAGYYATPTKIKTEVREVVKTVKEEQKTRIVYREKIIKVDGTIIEKEVEKEDTNTKEQTESTKVAKNETTKDIGLTLSALAVAPVSNITGDREYGVHVTKRVFSNIAVGVMATTDKKIGVSVGLTF